MTPCLHRERSFLVIATSQALRRQWAPAPDLVPLVDPLKPRKSSPIAAEVSRGMYSKKT
jgi:hypothetical protein